MVLKHYYNDDKVHEYMSKDGFDVIIFDYLKSLNLDKKIVLEVGAGFGRYTNCLSQLAKKVIALEPNQFMYDQHKINFLGQQNVITEQCSLQQIGSKYDNEKISYVFLFHVLHHLPENIFKEIVGLVERYNAKLIVIEPNHLNPQFFAQVLFTKDMSFEDEKGMFRNNSKTLFKAFQPEWNQKRFYIGWLPRGLNNFLASKFSFLTKYRNFKINIANPISAYSILEISK